MSLILIVDDNPSILEYIAAVLEETGYNLSLHSSAGEALEKFYSGDYDLVISDLIMPEMDGMRFISEIRRSNNDVPIIMITGVGGVTEAVDAMKSGATDFVVKPFQPDELRLKVEKNLEIYRMKRELNYLRSSLDKITDTSMLVGQSAPIKRLIAQIRQVAKSNASILIRGESGTGKELAAKMIHKESPRAKMPFMAIDCSTLTETIIESELFGYVKGAFTGADRTKKGILEEANGGTVFLDEIGNLSSVVQSKLLRFLQEKEIKPVGSNAIIKIDIRIVSATNADLKKSCKAGTFREDLYYRLAGIELNLPPLRERIGDIPILSEHFIRKYFNDTGKRVTGIEHEAVDMLSAREWKGNIRELEHLIEYAMIVESASMISAPTLRSIIHENRSVESEISDLSDLDNAVSEFETMHIKKVIKRAGGNKAKAAKMLGISRSLLYEKISKYNIE
jgi:DNA-binding NtrC family response regulator